MLLGTGEVEGVSKAVCMDRLLYNVVLISMQHMQFKLLSPVELSEEGIFFVVFFFS